MSVSSDNHIVNEPATIYGNTSYMDVMNYLHSVSLSANVKRKVVHRLNQELTEPALAAAYEKVDTLSILCDGWAGDGSSAISSQVIRNLKQVLLISENADWEEWYFAPDVNGTIGLQSKTHRALISLGENEFSYYSVIAGETVSGNHLPFSPESFLETMHRIA